MTALTRKPVGWPTQTGGSRQLSHCRDNGTPSHPTVSALLGRLPGNGGLLLIALAAISDRGSTPRASTWGHVKDRHPRSQLIPASRALGQPGGTRRCGTGVSAGLVLRAQRRLHASWWGRQGFDGIVCGSRRQTVGDCRTGRSVPEQADGNRCRRLGNLQLNSANHKGQSSIGGPAAGCLVSDRAPGGRGNRTPGKLYRSTV